MLELLGNLLCVAFFVRLFLHGTSTVATVTAIYLTIFITVGSTSLLGLLSPDLLSLDGQLIAEEGQFWRYASALVWYDALGLGSALQIWIFAIYSTLVERRHFAGAKLRYAMTLLAGAMLLLGATPAVGTDTTLSLSHALTFYVVGLWSRSEPQRMVQVPALVTTIRAAYAPWCLLLVCLPLTGTLAGLYNVVGLGGAIFVAAAGGLPPLAHKRSQRSQRSQARRSANDMYRADSGYAESRGSAGGPRPANAATIGSAPPPAQPEQAKHARHPRQARAEEAAHQILQGALAPTTSGGLADGAADEATAVATAAVAPAAAAAAAQQQQQQHQQQHQ